MRWKFTHRLVTTSMRLKTTECGSLAGSYIINYNIFKKKQYFIMMIKYPELLQIHKKLTEEQFNSTVLKFYINFFAESWRFSRMILSSSADNNK